jgi:hypothetical protein
VASEGDYCRAKAAECARFAEAAGTEEAKAQFLNLQRRWLEHAAKADAYCLAVSRQRAYPNRPTYPDRLTADEIAGQS